MEDILVETLKYIAEGSLENDTALLNLIKAVIERLLDLEKNLHETQVATLKTMDNLANEIVKLQLERFNTTPTKIQ